MNEITYFFGAGASCQSMPLVNNFYIRFEYFKSFVDNTTTNDRELYLQIDYFSKQIKSHLSFDTFFKKLFHQNRTEEINVYKGLLLLFFLFEHLFLPEDLGHEGPYLNKLNKGFIIDPRYEALIAGLLKPQKGKLNFYQNINFLTWNYDANLINALRNFVAPKEKLTDFIQSRIVNNSIQINEQVKLYHLNGFILHPLLDHIGDENLTISLSNLIYNYSSKPLNVYSNYIKFAWEQDINDFIEISEVIKDSETLVIVGYSFPLYNRIFDTKLINKKTINKTSLYIQNIDSTSIKNILYSDFGLGPAETFEDPDIVFTESCNSFTIPNEIFNG